jgi:hypothetical protein
MLVCIRPMPQTGIQDRKWLQAKDYVICKCGQPTCRDSEARRLGAAAVDEHDEALRRLCDLKGGGN